MHDVSSTADETPRRAVATVGFTLIELSIVLVIIGLIVGGVLVGQDLIKAAEVRKIISEKDAIGTAVYTFETKYSCLPGDCPNATNFWGQTAGCSVFATTPLTNGGPTCNGNGDGNIDFGQGAAGSYPGTSLEVQYFWHHLFNAGLINLP
jgi:prepilin-type N-terminal cleavage/methylation domain-containing protein